MDAFRKKKIKHISIIECSFRVEEFFFGYLDYFSEILLCWNITFPESMSSFRRSAVGIFSRKQWFVILTWNSIKGWDKDEIVLCPIVGLIFLKGRKFGQQKKRCKFVERRLLFSVCYVFGSVGIIGRWNDGCCEGILTWSIDCRYIWEPCAPFSRNISKILPILKKGSRW